MSAPQGGQPSAPQVGPGTNPVSTPTPPPQTGTRADELLVSFWFLLSAAAGIFFFVTYWIHAHDDRFVNALLGGSLAVALGGIGVGAILWAKRLMPAEEAMQDRHPFGSPPEEAEDAAESFRAGVAGSGIARRPLLRRSLLLASGTLALPLIAPLRSLSEKPKGELRHTAWTPGARLVLQDGTPIMLGDIEPNGFATVLPEGFTDIDSAAKSTAMLIHLPEDLITPKLAAKSVQGYVAFSKVCTHAGCPAGLYSQQTHTLVCPCHQSQFKVLEGCKPVSGPATRSLPQLAIMVGSDRYFRAVRDFDEPVGPGFWERS